MSEKPSVNGPTVAPEDWGLETYRRVIDNAGVGLFQTRPDGTYVYVNATLARMLGYDSEEDLLADDPAVGNRFYARPGQRDEFLRLMARDGYVHDYLIECRRDNGEHFWVSETSNALYAPDGTIAGYAGTLIDVTERVRAEASFRDLFNRATEGIFRSSPEGRFLRVNPALAELSGYDSEAEMIAAIDDIATQWYADPHRREMFMNQLGERDEMLGFESQIHNAKTGEILWVRENVRAVRDTGGRLLYFEGMVENVTERRRADAALVTAKEVAELADRAKSRFLANMSHELRTPLNSILGFSDMMRAEIYGPIGIAKYREYLGDIQSSASMLLQLIDDILDIAKHDAGKLSLDLETVEAKPLVEGVARMMSPRAERGGVALTVSAASGVTLRADPRRLKQILLNLVSNAIKFTGTDGRVAVRLTQTDTTALFVVEDTGIGIAAGDLARVFEPFERSSTAMGLAKDGTGLGLPLARDMARMHGGDIEIESTPDIGTIARLTLPIDGPGSIAPKEGGA